MEGVEERVCLVVGAEVKTPAVAQKAVLEAVQVGDRVKGQDGKANSPTPGERDKNGSQIPRFTGGLPLSRMWLHY